MTDKASERETTFDNLYREKGDPWDVTTSDYERTKFAATIASLPSGRHFRSVLDLGCSFGTLTQKLARRSDQVTAIDVSGEAIARARSELGNIARFERVELPGGWPGDRYDLIVMSEILYFLSREEILQMAANTERDLASNGLCLLVNWTGPSDLPLSGEHAAATFVESFQSHRDHTLDAIEHEKFRIDLLKPREAPSL